MEKSELEICLAIAVEAHKGQERRGGEAYVEHPKRVAAMLSDETQKCIALLHDVIEDTEETAESLRSKGVSEEVIEGALLLTKTKGQRYLDYIYEIAKHPKVAKVKTADMFDNLCGSPSERQKDKYRQAISILYSAV